ncbi:MULTISPECIES: shikimate dehydrogenase family protein [Gordonibacter]|uniref:Shikimate dehydrogenase n=1 Tax=Gordonibacter faecis TaxID=3047475 RepID=A0ABT7DJC4_9ACTN|nr:MULTISPECIES: shikimate dehydrogenase [unclassified Gordonibacter]MDJ1649624.1 shikimate dehydrogenase [Gordonibacter sp. KGMB12511]HIW76599.1 shikimate dehydrogenase [Candidatus Gordonibacter avicola]
MSEKLYLLGHPIAHSKSPAMYNAVYEQLGLPWRYELADLATEEEARAFLEARGFLSVNITTPYKPHAFEVTTHRAASAKLARGANLLVKHGEALIAYNTDGQGCVAYLERTEFVFAGATVVVCGTGPTALAILHACAVAGADEVVLVGRDKARAQKVLQGYVDELGDLSSAAIDLPAAQEGHRSLRQAHDDTMFKFGSYATSTQIIGRADLVINATPLGMKEGDPAPFDTSLLREGQRVFDVVYGHGETAFVAEARSAGCTVSDGAGMLVAQAVATVQIVTDLAEAKVNLDNLDLFALMSQAADFGLS